MCMGRSGEDLTVKFMSRDDKIRSIAKGKRSREKPLLLFYCTV